MSNGNSVSKFSDSACTHRQFVQHYSGDSVGMHRKSATLADLLGGVEGEVQKMEVGDEGGGLQILVVQVPISAITTGAIASVTIGGSVQAHKPVFQCWRRIVIHTSTPYL